MTVVQKGIGTSSVDELRVELRGAALVDGAPEFDERRAIWNRRYDRKPAVIVVPQDAGDVATAVRFANDHSLSVSVKGNGHHTGGWAVADDGLMIDLSHWKAAEVDPDSRIARVQPGLTADELNRATMEHDLALPTGKIGSVGVAGLTLGGGIGWLARKHGLTIDHLRSVEIVTADGQILVASRMQNAELFWGVRGAGTTLGVVTSFEFDLVPISTVLAGVVAYPLEMASQLATAYLELTASAPDELSSMLAITTMPDGPSAAILALTWCGDLTAGEQLLQPIRSLGTPLRDTIATMRYGALQSELAALSPAGFCHEMKSAFVDGFSRELFVTLAERYRSVVVPRRTTLFIEHYGGAVARVAADSTAFGNRAQDFNMILDTGWTEQAEQDAALRWLDETWNAVQPFTVDAAYINSLDMNDSDRIVQAFGASNYERIIALKRIYDPESIFRSNPVTPALP